MTALHTLTVEANAPAMMPPAPAALIAPASAEQISVESRWGVITATPEDVVDMPQGPLGFGQHRKFVMTELPNPKLSQFRLMQSMADPEVSFVVTPMAAEDGPIASSDLEEGCLQAGFTADDVTVLLILTVRNTPAGVNMSVNLRAPVLMDTRQRVARQVVLSNPVYSVRHPV